MEQQTEKKPKGVIEILDAECEILTNRIKELLHKFANLALHQYSDLIVEILSFRQELADYKRVRKNDVAKITHKIALEFENKLNEHKKNYDLTYVPFKDIKMAIESQLRDRIRDRTFIENQISFYDNCLDDLKSLHFDIKAKLEFEKGLL